MIFIIQYKDQSSTIVSSTTLSDVAAYVEGTGKEFFSINQPNYGTLVLNSPSSNNCFQIFLKNNTTGVSTSYFVFDEDYQSLNTWIESQGDVELTSLQKIQRNYVSL